MLQKNYICDRCGREKIGHSGITIQMRNGDEIREISWLSLRCRTGFVRNIDLCEDCLNKFKEWYFKPLDEI